MKKNKWMVYTTILLSYILFSFQAPAQADLAIAIQSSSLQFRLATPEQISPRNGSKFSHYPRKLVLRWKAIQGMKYDVEVDCFGCSGRGKWSSNVGVTWHIKRGLTTTQYLHNFVGDQPGRWRVRSVKGSIRSKWSPWWNFTFAPPTLAIPEQISPRNGSKFSHYPRKLVLRWKAIQGMKYDVEVDCFGCSGRGKWSSNVGVTWHIKRGLTITQYLHNFVGDQPGRWRVRSVKGSIRSKWSPWWNFTFAPPTLAIPEQISPRNGSKFSHYPRKLVLRWKAIQGMKYDVEVDCFGCSGRGKWSSNVGVTWHIKRGLTITQYLHNFVGDQPGRWRVRSVKGSIRSKWSPWWNFTFAPPTLAIPEQISPRNGSKFSHYPRKLILRWKGLQGMKYDVEVDCFGCSQRGKWSSDVGHTWLIARGLTITQYLHNFVGDQPGRWRVRSVKGSIRSKWSPWWNFTFAPPILAIPEQISPRNGSKFSHYPRKLILRWKGLQGMKYDVEVDCFGCSQRGKWSSDVGHTWHIKRGLTITQYLHNFVGSQPGRWRVRSVKGSIRSKWSSWWNFSF